MAEPTPEVVYEAAARAYITEIAKEVRGYDLVADGSFHKRPGHRAAVDSAYSAGVAAGRAQAAARLQPLLDSWYHDPDCQIGRRELRGVCACFELRWEHNCAVAVRAVLDGGEPRG